MPIGGEDEFMRRRHINERGKTQRAYQAYVDLMDTAEWLRDEFSGQLASFDLTMMEYRVMERIYRRGPQYQTDISRRFRCSKQNIAWVVSRLEDLGRVRRVTARLRAKAPAERRAYAKAPAGRSGKGTARRRSRAKATGRRIIHVHLTPEGRELFANVFPKHAKYVKAEMRTLEGREQKTLSHLCRKLRGGDVEKFFREFRMMDWNEGPDWHLMEGYGPREGRRRHL
ncbi:MAG: MarR family transcriptional regulator [Candidatus Acidiferrales bacterium]